MKTVVGTFDNIQNAYAAANDLVSAGYNRNDISVVATNTNNQYSPYVDTRLSTQQMMSVQAQVLAPPSVVLVACW